MLYTIATSEMTSESSGERFALISLFKAAANPSDCENSNGMQFALDLDDSFANTIFLEVSDAFFDDEPVSLIIEGCAFGYPRIVKIKGS